MEYPNKYNHVETEKELKEFWENENVYSFDYLSDKKIFSIDTPPPYVSASHLHAGHAMSYAQADFIARYKRQKGFNVFYPMGFDDNGLPTERFVENKYKINKSKITRKEFIDLCLKETQIGIEKYKEIWIALGLSVDWSFTFSTINEWSRKTSQLSFLDLLEKQLIERRKDVVQWCTHCQTSLAQADISVEEKETRFYDIKFKSEIGDDLIISTTRPELIPACVALYAHPTDERYSHLKDKNAIVPIFDYQVPIKFDESVDKDFGTGLMMVCTFGDIEDGIKWKKDKLDTRIIIDDKGIAVELAGKYQGTHISKLRDEVLKDLENIGAVLNSKKLVHNVGIHERCGTTVEFNVKPQWFIEMLKNKETFLKLGDELNWYPEFMKIRYTDWVSNLKWDWNISRQRYYGVPIPVWYCEKCSEAIFPKATELPVDPTIDKPIIDKCPKCGSTSFIPEDDVMDTWMTSSVSPLINGKWAYEDNLMETIFPMDLRPQGFEIIRTWLFYTIVKSYYHTGKLPWKDAMISGWGLDKDGKKMSKSLGNYVGADDVIDKSSADALRYWAAKGTLGHDLRYNQDEINDGKKLQIKLWNAGKFLFHHLQNSSYDKNNIKLFEVDKWVLSELQKTIQICTEYFDKYNYSHALRTVDSFFWNIYTDNYLELIKDRLWNPDNYSKENISAAVDTMYKVFLGVLKMFAPIIPYVTDKIYQIIFKEVESHKSIHLAGWPVPDKSLVDEEASKEVEVLLIILRGIRKHKTENQIHQTQIINELIIDVPNDIKDMLRLIERDLKSALRVNLILFGTGEFETENPSIKLKINI